MLDKELRIQFGKNAHNDMKEYSPEVLLNQWEELFNKINNCKTVNEYIKVVNESKLPLIYKKRLKECK